MTPSEPRAWRAYALAAAATVASAAAGALPVKPDSDWYRGLAKPRWQPPPQAFGLIWPPLYVSIAWSAGRALGRARGRPRRALAASVGVNLALNAGWTWMFFGLRRPRAGLAGTVLLDLSNLELIRRMARTDPRAAAALAPYAAWCVFATALNASIARRNPAS
jgi:benzodiazapine receptor